jgi:hypothetical protein
MIERFVSNELDGMWMGAVLAELGYYNGIFLERLRKTTRSLSHCSYYATHNSNQTPPELKLERLLLEPTWLVSSKNITIRHYFLQFSLMCFIPIVSIQINQQNNQSIHSLTLYYGDLTCFGCVKQPTPGFIFQKYIQKKLYSYSHTFNNKTYG